MLCCEQPEPVPDGSETYQADCDKTCIELPKGYN